jgi:steroid delta-isomerase-like uncharacterized protein
MSIEENKAIVRRYFAECWQQGNIAKTDEFIAADAVSHSPFVQQRGPEGWKHVLTMVLTAFPDRDTTVEDVIAEGDKVVVRWTTRATNKGSFMGMPPTGKQATYGGIDIYRVADGKIVEHWDQVDALGMMQQLGMIPAPEHSGR